MDLIELEYTLRDAWRRNDRERVEALCQAALAPADPIAALLEEPDRAHELAVARVILRVLGDAARLVERHPTMRDPGYIERARALATLCEYRDLRATYLVTWPVALRLAWSEHHEREWTRLRAAHGATDGEAERSGLEGQLVELLTTPE